jgi:hypothetical protein
MIDVSMISQLALDRVAVRLLMICKIVVLEWVCGLVLLSDRPLMIALRL